MFSCEGFLIITLTAKDFLIKYWFIVRFNKLRLEIRFAILVNKGELLLLSLVRKPPIRVSYKVNVVVLVVNLVALQAYSFFFL